MLHLIVRRWTRRGKTRGYKILAGCRCYNKRITKQLPLTVCLPYQAPEVVRIHASSGTTGDRQLSAMRLMILTCGLNAPPRALPISAEQRTVRSGLLRLRIILGGLVLHYRTEKARCYRYLHRQETACVSLKCSGISALL